MTGALFTSSRERRLWLWAGAAVVAIFATLGQVPAIASALAELGSLDQMFFNTFVVLVVTMVFVGFLQRPGWREIAVGAAVVTVYAMAFLRFGAPAERTHLFEFGVIAVLIYLALLERQANGVPVRAPGWIAFGSAASLGWIDEGVQAILPNRFFDPVDLAFNTAAALGAVLSVMALRWARSRRGHRTPLGEERTDAAG